MFDKNELLQVNHLKKPDMFLSGIEEHSVNSVPSFDQATFAAPYHYHISSRSATDHFVIDLFLLLSFIE